MSSLLVRTLAVLSSFFRLVGIVASSIMASSSLIWTRFIVDISTGTKVVVMQLRLGNITLVTVLYGT